MLYKRCLLCGIEFVDSSRGKNKKFCCARHRGQYRWTTNREKLSSYNRQYEARNFHRVRARKNLYRRNRYRTDPVFAMSLKLRARINRAVERKTASLIELIGCSVEELKRHIESMFQPGMSWSNYGEWELDHIVPVSLFDLSTVQGQRQAFHYTNLQPLWREDNRRKGNRAVPPPENRQE